MFPRPKYMVYMCQVKRPPNFPKPSCVRDGNEDLLPYLQQQVMEKNLIQAITPVPTGCLNRCNFGPVMTVEPGNFMYVDLTKEKIDEIIQKHFVDGNPVEEYLIPAEWWGEPLEPKVLVR